MAGEDESGALWTSAQVARVFGVGVSSIKRWTDNGKLESVKTIGGHRRYQLDALHAFAKQENLPTDDLPPLDVAIDMGAEDGAIVTNLLDVLDRGNVVLAGKTIKGYLGRISDPVGFLDKVVGELLMRVGELWAQGVWAVEKEHRSAYCVAEAIDRARHPDPGEGPTAILACPPGELHSIPLNMIRYVLSRNGWRTDFVGADVPWDALHAAVVRQKPELALLTSRSEVPFNSPEFTRVADEFRRQGTIVCIGGSWARGGGKKRRCEPRFRSLAGFERWLHSRAV